MLFCLTLRHSCLFFCSFSLAEGSLFPKIINRSHTQTIINYKWAKKSSECLNVRQKSNKLVLIVWRKDGKGLEKLGKTGKAKENVQKTGKKPFGRKLENAMYSVFCFYQFIKLRKTGKRPPITTPPLGEKQKQIANITTTRFPYGNPQKISNRFPMGSASVVCYPVEINLSWFPSWKLTEDFPGI